MPKTKSETKDKPVMAYFTRTFKKRLVIAAEHEGLTAAEFVRNATIEKVERLNGKRKP